MSAHGIKMDKFSWNYLKLLTAGTVIDMIGENGVLKRYGETDPNTPIVLLRKKLKLKGEEYRSTINIGDLVLIVRRGRYEKVLVCKRDEKHCDIMISDPMDYKTLSWFELACWCDRRVLGVL